jgi:hypothetical protein
MSCYFEYATDVHWPFQFVLDARDRHTGWMLLNGPIVSPPQQREFVELRRAGYRFIGMSSYIDFPRGCLEHLLDYEMVCDAWCHCFREPKKFLRRQLPQALISASDFVDAGRISPGRFARLAVGDSYDLVYVGAEASWKREVKNWSLAARVIPRLCADLGLRALVVGPPGNGFEPSPRVTFIASQPWTTLLAYIEGARFLLVPNEMDASPRTIAEALCLDTAVLVHREILGGWKYVNRFTGGFFDGEHDVVAAVRTLDESTKAPRRWFRANYGPYLAGRRLLSLIRSIDPAIVERSHVHLSDAIGQSAPDTSR